MTDTPTNPDTNLAPLGQSPEFFNWPRAIRIATFLFRHRDEINLAPKYPEDGSFEFVIQIPPHLYQRGKEQGVFYGPEDRQQG